jgi:hypothetical protein
MNIVQKAADYGLPSHMKSILTFSGVNPNLAGNGTSPPLILAAKAGHYDVIKVMREHKDRAEKGFNSFSYIEEQRSSVLISTIGISICSQLYKILF